MPFQSERNLMERLKHLWTDGTYADVHFLIEEGDKKELLPAHKVILAMHSDVFDAMFRFDAKNAIPKNEVNKPVLITDIGVVAFKTMLSFIYSNDLHELTGDNAMAVLYAAKKYNIAQLVKACVGNFTIPTNVFLALTQTRFLEEEALAGRCMKYIDRNADQLFKSKSFLQADQKLLCEILNRDQLMIKEEIAIWKAALRWTDGQCRRNGMDCSGTNRRAMLGPALHKIRFSLIPKEEFSESIVPSAILTPNEVINVLQCHANDHPNRCSVPEMVPSLFPTHHRWAYITEGRISMKIEKFSEFAREDEGNRRLSDAVYVSGLPWKILVASRVLHYNGVKCLGFFLQCNGEDYDPNWSCACSATMRIVAQKEGAADYIRKFKHTFNANENDRGFKYLKSLEELMDPSKGWHNEAEDSVTLAIDFTPEEPIYVE